MQHLLIIFLGLALAAGALIWLRSLLRKSRDEDEDVRRIIELWAEDHEERRKGP